MVVAVNPDSDSVTVLDAQSLQILAEIPVGDDPRTLAIAPDSQSALVTNHAGATLSLLDLAQLVEVGSYAVGSMPYGVVTDGARVFVSEFAPGHVGVLDHNSGERLAHIAVAPFPAGLALSADGASLYVTHLFSGRVTLIDARSLEVKANITTGASTNLSQFVAISPNGTKAYLPQTRSNVTNTAMLFDNTVFAVVNVLDLGALRLAVQERVTLDTADQPVNMPFAVALSPDGKMLYLANAGSDDLSVIDLSTNQGVAHISVGANPRGIAISPDGARVFVNNVLDGTLSVMETEMHTIAETVTLTEIPLPEPILLGKRIFNSAAAPVLTTDNWISCATCHFDGMMDTRTWLGFPDGPRNTPSLLGVAQTLPMHWSGDLDELQDVEITIRDIQIGSGLIEGEAHDTLGSAHAGLSPELDALAMYMAILEIPPSPYAASPEQLSRGEAVFNTLECQSCHPPPLYTDLQLHDVGTGNAAKEKNSHGRGTNFDTPSLRALWMTAPYFHDGSATTLPDALHTGNEHNVAAGLSTTEIEDLTAFLLALP
jgi:YVTN family beta-propeller protein